jgi:hypothetical protein
LAIGWTVSLLVGFSTPLWFYAQADFSEPLQGLLLTAILLSLIRSRPGGSFGPVFWTGLNLALLMLTKAIYVALAPILLIALLWRCCAANLRSILLWGRSFEQPGADKAPLSIPASLTKILSVSFCFGLPVIAGGLLYLAWNYGRFGSPFKFGYAEVFHTPLLLVFDTPLLVGLYGWFFSSGKSVFLYAPVLILLIGALPHFAKRHPFETVVIAAMTIPLVILYGKYRFWAGDWAWALRYAVPLVPLWVLPVATVLASGKAAWRTAVASLGAFGVFVQVLGVAINPANYLSMHVFDRPGQSKDMKQSMLDVHFIPEFSPLAAHWWLLRATIERMRSPGKNPSEYVILHSYPWSGRAERERWKPEHPEYALGPNFWMFHDMPYMSETRIRALLGVSFALVVIGLGLSVLGFKSDWKCREI